MNNLGEAYCNLGMELFEVGEYEQSVQNLVKAYELGYRKDEIHEHLYACFILPNEEEFRNHYSINSLEISQLPYEKLLLDFVPVSDEQFFIFDREQQKFFGIFELEQEPIQGKEIEFGSCLFTELWDIREILQNLKEKEWETVYLLLNDQEPKFASFLKLPRFKELYLRKVIAFKDDQLMHDFFECYDDFYLPKMLGSSEPEKYSSILKELHEKRIHSNQKERTNIFLSICIPSYNRGSIALDNVLRILQSPYDSEIEIVVSNNGSTQDTEGYQEIKEIDDARIKYHEFSTNQGYATNVIKILEMASGDFAVLASDEDFIILENLQEFLSYIKANVSGGLFLGSGLGSDTIYFENKNVICNSGADAIRWAVNLNYITGITYNMKLLREIDAFKIIQSMRGNRFLEPYVHIVFAMLACKYMDFHRTNILLWDARGKKDPAIDQERKPKILSYMFPENRIAQLKEVLEILQRGIMIEEKDFIRLYLDRWKKTYHLLQLAYKTFDDLKRIYTWEDICFYLYRENIKYINGFPVMLTIERKEHLQDLARNMFLESLRKEEMFAELSKEEKQKKEVLHHLIKIELEGYGDDIIKNSYQIFVKGVGIEDSFLQACTEEAVSQNHPIAYIYEKHWKNIEAKRDKNVTAWDV